MGATLNTIIEKVNTLPKPIIIGVSGFGGSGKSTFALELGKKVQAPVIGVDSFFKSNAHAGCNFWDVVDFERLRKEVLEPFGLGGQDITYRNFDWATNRLGKEVHLSHNGIVIIEGVGLFRPALMKYFSCTIWIDCPIQ